MPSKLMKGQKAAVHTSVPPLVEGKLRGYISVCLRNAVEWKCSVGPPAPKLSVRLRWWGEKTAGTLFRVPVAMDQTSGQESSVGPNIAYFPIRAGLSQLSAYLKDMGVLVFEVGLGHMSDASMVIGRASVSDAIHLVAKGQIQGMYSIKSQGDVLLGKLHILLQMHIKSVLDGEGVTRPPAVAIETEGPPIAAEFIVGPGATFKEQPPPVGKGIIVKTKKSNVRLVGQLAAKQEKEGVGEAQDRSERGDPSQEENAPIIGKKQMEVISELLEKGHLLREKIVHSLTTGSQLGQWRKGLEEEEEETAIPPELLTLVSAELATQDRGPESRRSLAKSLANLVYNEFSDNENISAGEDSSSSSPSNPWVTSGVQGGATEDSGCVMADVSSPVAAKGRGHVAAAGQPVKGPSRVPIAKDTGGRLSGTDADAAQERIGGMHSEGLEAKGRIVSSSVTSLSAGQEALETDIARSMGLEQLTRLSRATCARVVVDSLQVDPTAISTIITCKKKSKSAVPNSTALGATYLVEYRFPAALLDTKSSRYAHEHVYEVMRVASKRVQDGKITFNHCSVFPVLLNSKVLQSWWNSSLIFRVYCRPQQQRMPYLVGKSVASMKSWLLSPALRSDCALPVHSSSLVEALHCGTSQGPCIGELKVTIEMLMGKTPFPALGVPRPPNPVKTDYPVSSPGNADGGGPIKFKEMDPALATPLSEIKLSPLQLMLMIPEATGITLVETGDPSPPPNCYLVCKLCCGQPHPKTPVEWKTSNPQFLFRQLFPLCQRKDIIDMFCNNFCVVEVWHRVTEKGCEDQLLGLVKLSLHQFFLAFSEPSSASLSVQAKFPVVAVDSYCPIVDPISGRISGRLAALLALGTPDQVSYLLQQYASGCYSIQPAHQETQPKTIEHSTPKPGGREGGRDSTSVSKENGDLSRAHHQFMVQVEGIRSLEVARNTVWGEADCFIQYHFPTVSEEEGEIDLCLHPYRTPTALYMPNPSFSHPTTHLLSLPKDRPIGQALARAGGQGMSGQLSFELWRRFYFPNIRDQLLAKANLPLVKLCALVGMNCTLTSSSQVFALPLHPLSAQPTDTMEGSVGVLDVGIGYKVLSHHGATQQQDSSVHINLSLGVLRVAGLKRAAALAAKDHPLPLDFAAEAGVNPYAKISSAVILPEPQVTVTMARTFASEMSHFTEISVPLAVGRHSIVLPLQEVSASKLLEGSFRVEVWHQVPKRDSRHCPDAEAKIIGRRLGPSFQDVLLGVAHIPLKGLLRHTGVHGWYPLLPPAAPHVAPISGPTHLQHWQNPPVVTCTYVGGVEISLAFSTARDRQLFQSAADPVSYQLSKLADVGSARQWVVELQVESLWVEDKIVFRLGSTLSRQAAHCFVRYRFFDLNAVMSTPRRASFSHEGLSHYLLRHKAILSLPHSLQLEWYLSEEHLELQVWASPLSHSVRPASTDVLIGSVYVLLSDLLAQGGSLSGWYPVFKAGAEDLGEQAVYLRINMTAAPEGAEPFNGVRVLDSTDDVETTPPPATENELEKEVPCPEQVRDNLDAVTFKARLVIHEALHLPLLRDAQSRECPPSAYVTVRPHPSLERIETPVVPSSCRPSWNYQCSTPIASLHLQTQDSGLEFLVCSSTEIGEDRHIGSAKVDLSPLSYGLAQVSGWYHIMEFAGDVCGQLKVSILPEERQAFPCQRPRLSAQVGLVSAMQCREQLSSNTSSELFQQLRDDMEHLHQFLRTKLHETEGNQETIRDHQDTCHASCLHQSSDKPAFQPLSTSVPQPPSHQPSIMPMLQHPLLSPSQPPSRQPPSPSHPPSCQPFCSSPVLTSSEKAISVVNQQEILAASSWLEASSVESSELQTSEESLSSNDVSVMEGQQLSAEDGRMGEMAGSEGSEMDSGNMVGTSESEALERDVGTSRDHSAGVTKTTQAAENSQLRTPSPVSSITSLVGPSSMLPFEGAGLPDTAADRSQDAHSVGPISEEHTTPTTSTVDVLTGARHSRVPAMGMPWPHLPDYFLSPHDLEQSLRSIRAVALSGFPPPPKPQEHQAATTAAARNPPRQRSKLETDRLAKIFSSRPP